MRGAVVTKLLYPFLCISRFCLGSIKARQEVCGIIGVLSPEGYDFIVKRDIFGINVNRTDALPAVSYEHKRPIVPFYTADVDANVDEGAYYFDIRQ
jgi:hypothetical protein